MRIGVIIPSEDQKNQAGVRIRYERIQSALKANGHDLEIISIQKLASISRPEYDIFLISKCYDARSILAAQQLRNQGAHVGVDLFDDYFSQLNDSRFVRIRYWLRNLLPHCSFILCSTTCMQVIANNYGPDLPIHVMNDPAVPFEKYTLAETLERKLIKAKNERRIDIAWFGMGDNPNFPVGLTDLAAYCSDIDRLSGYGYECHLSILTNQRAMNSQNLALVRKLATPYRLEEWTTEREAALLAHSLVSFLPVNAQGFSRVKSLNRAITALSSGTQVLSSGYPLYQQLGKFVYRSPSQFITDLKLGEMKMRNATTSSFCELTRQLANDETEARKLIQFFSGLQQLRQRIENKSIFAVIHGKQTLGDTHKFAQKKNIISIASPLCTLKLNFDVCFQYNQQGKLQVLVSQKKINMVDFEIAAMFAPSTEQTSTEYRILDVSKSFPDILTPAHSLMQLDTDAANAAFYPIILGCMDEILKRIFPGISWVISEQSKRIPWVPPTKSVAEVI